MTAADALASLKAHLAKQGYGDIEVNMTAGTIPHIVARRAIIRKNSKFIGALDRSHCDAAQRRLLAGVCLHGVPLRLPAGGFGLGHATRSSPNEYFLIESTKPESARQDGSVRFVRRVSVRDGGLKLSERRIY